MGEVLLARVCILHSSSYIAGWLLAACKQQRCLCYGYQKDRLATFFLLASHDFTALLHVRVLFCDVKSVTGFQKDSLTYCVIRSLYFHKIYSEVLHVVLNVNYNCKKIKKNPNIIHTVNEPTFTHLVAQDQQL
jgi:hypothetical protein